MSAYTPPTGIYGVYNSLKFDNNEFDNFLNFPIAQGDETLKNIVVNGTSTFNELLTTNNIVNFNNTALGSLTSLSTQPASNNSSTMIPTTAWVQTAISGLTPTIPTLSQVLLSNNSAGSTSINMNNNDITNVNNLDVDGFATLNSATFMNGVLTTTAQIDMTGNIINYIATRQLILKDATSGNSNGTSIYTNGNLLILDSAPSAGNNSAINFALRNTLNVSIIPLQLFTTSVNSNLPLLLSSTVGGQSLIRSKIYSFYDINIGSPSPSSIYYQASGMNVECLSANSIFNVLTQNGVGGNTNALIVNSTNISTDTPTIPLTNDNSNKIPTTAWVQNVLSTYSPSIPSNYAKRAYLHYCGTQLNPNTTDALWSIIIPNITYEQNDFLSFHLTFSCNRLPSTAPNAFYLSQRAFTYSADIDIYPYRIVSSNAGWCYNSAFLGNAFAEVTTNQINGNASYNVIIDNPPTPYAKYGRQFWSYGAIYTYFSGTPSSDQRIYINGDPTNLFKIDFRVPYPGDNWTYTCSLVLLTPVIGAGAGSPINITTSGFNVNL